MIEVYVYTNAQDHIIAYEITGHAHYADPGQDIVCAGVSAVSIGTVNALEELLDIHCEAEMNEDGYLSAILPAVTDPERFDQAQLLLRSMVVTLKGIEASYDAYVRIQFESEGGKTPC
ncbi:ribosomal-processing cysteine protease Prp [Marinicrinis sediminis]|uniref:Ribosomal processing cysteine protease Prp n=1 Tax=Marinicrinis sediminis TaxID=1652465 RepID=A0ABW5R6U8_9BACL